jgi:hypothetical protein
MWTNMTKIRDKNNSHFYIIHKRETECSEWYWYFFRYACRYVDLKWYVAGDLLAFNCPLNVLTFQRKEKENKKQKTKRNGLTSTLSLSYVISLCNVFASPSNFFEASQDGAIPNKRKTASMTIVMSRGGFTKAFISVKCRFNCYTINVSNVNLDLQNKGI